MQREAKVTEKHLLERFKDLAVTRTNSEIQDRHVQSSSSHTTETIPHEDKFMVEGYKLEVPTVKGGKGSEQPFEFLVTTIGSRK